MTEAARRKRNEDRLKELFPAFARRIKAVIADMENMNLRPRIQDAHRSREDQLKAFNEGHSKLKFGFHNVTAADGTPEALAVDLIDDNNPLSSPTPYLLKLAGAARKRGLVSGVLWGLPAALRQGVDAAIAADNFDAKVKVGWDPTHIEPTGITVAQAKAGARPT
ncbi:MAG: hypothetical protein ABI759_07760 [Candidatus Solibacter sp.]